MASFLHSHRNPARFDGHHNASKSHATISSSLPKLTLSTKSLRSGSSQLQRNDTLISPLSPDSPRSSRLTLDRDMSPSQKASSPLTSSAAAAAPAKSHKHPTLEHAKLHKRGGSGSLPGPPSPFVSGHQFTTPYATYEYEETGPTHLASSATTKIKPYLRKMASAKEDQGTIDLDKSIAENERLAGLGIHHFASRSAADVTFGHPNRRQTHARTTSIGSQASNGSSTFRTGGQPFIHPATKVPRPYTPPGASYASSVNDDEADESNDVVEDEFRPGPGFRSKRSMSITSSTNPTPLSQSHTASDLGLIPKLTNVSQSNLSIMSRASSTSNQKSRPRRGTDHSDLATSPQTMGRPSIDKALSLVSGRRSDPDTQSRDEAIRNARRKFEEKEAKKDNREQKRRESEEAKKEAARQRKQSNVSERAGMKTAAPGHTSSEDKIPGQKRKGSTATVLSGAPQASQEDTEVPGTLYARSYEDYRPAHAATLPRHGDVPGESEKTGRIQYTMTAQEQHNGSWMRFSTWAQTRLLSCGRGRRS